MYSGEAAAARAATTCLLSVGADPYRRHDHRLFDGHAWTDQVSDAGATSIDVPVHPVPAAPDAGWAADPFGRFEQRYFDGGRWTQHVVQDGTSYVDLPS